MKSILASLLLLVALFSIVIATGCGAVQQSGGKSNTTSPPKPAPTVAVTPAAPKLRVGTSQQFKATVTGATAQTFNWMVSAVAGGNATLGTIDKNGMYKAPAKVPTAAVMITATSSTDEKITGDTDVTLENPVPKITAVTPTSTAVGSFNVTVTGSNFVAGAVIVFNGKLITTTFVSSTQLKATAEAAAAGKFNLLVANPDPGSADSASVSIAVAAPPPGPPANPLVSVEAAARFLEQSTWGPTPALVTQVQTVGFQSFLNSQLAAAASKYPAPGVNDGVDVVQNRFFVNAVTGSDQLRQRMAFALSEIMVVSALKVNSAQAMTLWQNMLQKDALGNFSTLLTDVTVSPVMGNYLDMVNNDKPNPTAGTAPNENYAREALQLFTIGLQQLNPDGTPQLDGSGNPIPTFTQDSIFGFARAYTGWTYPTTTGTTANFPNNPNYSGPMISFDSHHDTDTETMLNGAMLPAGGTAQGDLTAALKNIFEHPNVGPFISKQLIEHLVTSNPSPDYVARVAAVFNDNGKGVRGDLSAVAKAILLDTEARRGDDPTQAQASDGHLKEPLLFMMNLLRATNASTDGQCLADAANHMKQDPMFSGSVFNFFHPDAVIPGTNLLGPEFEILDGGSAIARINFVNTLVYGQVCNTTKTNLSSYVLIAGDSNKLLNTLASFMLHGQMSSDMRTVLSSALVAETNTTKRTQAALYLIGSSSQFQVEH